MFMVPQFEREQGVYMVGCSPLLNKHVGKGNVMPGVRLPEVWKEGSQLAFPHKLWTNNPLSNSPLSMVKLNIAGMAGVQSVSTQVSIYRVFLTPWEWFPRQCSWGYLSVSQLPRCWDPPAERQPFALAKSLPSLLTRAISWVLHQNWDANASLIALRTACLLE